MVLEIERSRKPDRTKLVTSFRLDSGMMKLGMQPTEAWYTVFGDGPQILQGSIAEDLPTIGRAAL